MTPPIPYDGCMEQSKRAPLPRTVGSNFEGDLVLDGNPFRYKLGFLQDPAQMVQLGTPPSALSLLQVYDRQNRPLQIDEPTAMQLAEALSPGAMQIMQSHAGIAEYEAGYLRPTGDESTFPSFATLGSVSANTRGTISGPTEGLRALLQ